MPHKIEASHPAYGQVTWEIEAASPEKAFAIWKQIVSNPRGWNRIVNESAPAKPSGLRTTTTKRKPICSTYPIFRRHGETTMTHPIRSWHSKAAPLAGTRIKYRSQCRQRLLREQEGYASPADTQRRKELEELLGTKASEITGPGRPRRSPGATS